MKKILLSLALVLLLVAPSFSQKGSVVQMLSSYGKLSDTVTNTGTAYLQAQYVAPSVGTTTMITYNVIETSGTTAGTVTLQGSLDGITYATISSTTHSPADVTTQQNFAFVITGCPAYYYRVLWTGAGTMVGRLRDAKITAH
jgi:hypothetical protein